MKDVIRELAGIVEVSPSGRTIASTHKVWEL